MENEIERIEFKDCMVGKDYIFCIKYCKEWFIGKVTARLSPNTIEINFICNNRWRWYANNISWEAYLIPDWMC